MSAPTLFILAADLTKMQVNANIDEADVGRMRPGQVVTFRVDAYPTDTFTGSVQQVRLQPTTVQNVVTYQTVIEVPNPELKLKPGMTANVNIEVARRNNVLRIPTAATRFRPTEEIFAALKQPVPPEAQAGAGSPAAVDARADAGRRGQPATPAGRAARPAAATGRRPRHPRPHSGAHAAGRRAGAGTGPWHGRRIGRGAGRRQSCGGPGKIGAARPSGRWQIRRARRWRPGRRRARRREHDPRAA